MSSLITCVYTALAAGAFTGAQLATKIGAVGLDSQLLVDYGLAVQSDTTGNAGSAVTRTIVLVMIPSVGGVATAALGGSNNGTGVSAVTLSFAGAGYVAPPVVTAQTQAGHPSPIRPALFHAVLSGGVISSIVVDDPGIGYDVAPNVVITPLFKAMCPDTGDQVSPMSGFMTEILQNTVLTPVVASVPVVS